MVFCWEKKAAPHNNRIHFVLFVCVLCTVWCFVWFLHEMVLLLHENLNYCTKRIWCLCKLQNKNFSMVCCTTLWWEGAGKGRGWKTAAIIYCWQQQHVRGQTAQLSDISSGATCVADLDSGALALTKEASGNSRALTQTAWHKMVGLFQLSIQFLMGRNQVKNCWAFLFIPFQTEIKWKNAEPLFFFHAKQTKNKWKTTEPLFRFIPNRQKSKSSEKLLSLSFHSVPNRHKSSEKLLSLSFQSIPTNRACDVPLLFTPL